MFDTSNAFIEGRKILDSIIIAKLANDCLDITTTNSSSQNFEINYRFLMDSLGSATYLDSCLKFGSLNMAKANDHLNWDFLIYLFQRYGFRANEGLYC